MAPRNSTQKKLPGLCYIRQTGWYYSDIPDASHPRGRRRHYWGKNRNEVRRLYRQDITQFVAEYAARRPETVKIVAAQTWTVTDLGKEYFLAKKADGCSVSTLGNIKKYMPQFMHWLKDHGIDAAVGRPAELTTTLLADYRNMLAANSSIGRVEANHYIEVVRGMLKWGMDTHDLRPPAMGAIRKFPARAKVGHGRKQDRTPLTWEQLKKLLGAANPVDTALLLLGINCGFGATDIGVLKHENVDLKDCIISGHRSKTGVARNFWLWPETVNALRIYQDQHRGKPRDEAVAELSFVTRKGNPFCWTWIDQDGKKHRSDAVKNRFDKVCRRAGIALPYGAGFYILRHTYATMIALDSQDPREVQAAMAHATLRQQETYRHDREVKAQAAQMRLHKRMRAKLPRSLLRRLSAVGEAKSP